jgi:hypothetical protein
MTRSSIKIKPCKCGCGKMPTMSCGGYNYGCLPAEMKEKLGTRKALSKRTKIKTVSLSRKLHLAQDDVKAASASLERWFNERHKEMAGYCKHCNGRSQKGYPNYKCSVAHILPKNFFNSISTHPDNWIELCFYGKSCHTNLDNNMLDLIDLNCFDEVITKFVRMYPDIDPKERRRIPAVLVQYIETEK